MTTRRKMLAATASVAALSVPAVLRAQAKPPVLVGWLNNGPRDVNLHYLTAFKSGMAAFGWKEDVNYTMEERWAGSVPERLQPMAKELAAKKPALVVAATLQSVIAASKFIPDVPIVLGDGGSPVTAGLAASLARPGGRVTGITNIAIDFAPKFLEFLLEVAPYAKRIGFLVDTGNSISSSLVETFLALCEKRRIQAHFARVAKPDQLDAALAALAKNSIQGLILLPATFFVAERERIVRAALAYRWPISCGPHEFAEAGALVSYGPDRSAMYRRAAYFVDRLLKGAKPADLPIEQPTVFDMMVNLKTAKALGITLPPTVMVRATRVIE